MLDSCNANQALSDEFAKTTARSDYDSFLSCNDTTQSGDAIKPLFIEEYDSFTLLSFNDIRLVVIASAGFDSEKVAYEIGYELLFYYRYSLDKVDCVHITIISDNEDIWAIAYPFHHLDGHTNFYVFFIRGSATAPEPVLVSEAPVPVSQGFTIEALTYTKSNSMTSKTLVYGGIINTHLCLESDSLIDLSLRSYMVVEGCTTAVRLAVPANGEWLSNYICIIDSEPTEIVLYDIHENVILRLSERPNELVVRIRKTDLVFD
jgi:hypothetical protein